MRYKSWPGCPPASVVASGSAVGAYPPGRHPRWTPVVPLRLGGGGVGRSFRHEGGPCGRGMHVILRALRGHGRRGAFPSGAAGAPLTPVLGDAQVPRGAAGTCRALCNRGSGGLPREDVPWETALPGPAVQLHVGSPAGVARAHAGRSSYVGLPLPARRPGAPLAVECFREVVGSSGSLGVPCRPFDSISPRH